MSLLGVLCTGNQIKQPVLLMIFNDLKSVSIFTLIFRHNCSVLKNIFISTCNSMITIKVKSQKDEKSSTILLPWQSNSVHFSLISTIITHPCINTLFTEVYLGWVKFFHFAIFHFADVMLANQSNELHTG